MSILLLRLLVDFGLLVLIWMIQLIVYPSFLYYKTENLIMWHKKYTLLIGYIVTPLMLLELGITAYLMTVVVTFYNVVSLAIIVMVWISTFLQFVPIHNNILKGRVCIKMLSSLITKNWIRTVLWTILFLLSLYYVGF